MFIHSLLCYAGLCDSEKLKLQQQIKTLSIFYDPEIYNHFQFSSLLLLRFIKYYISPIRKMYGSRMSVGNDLEVQQLITRMRMGTGVNSLLKAENAPTHHMDSLQQFKKDFASFDRDQRDKEIAKKQLDIERKRLQHLERQNQRWEKAEKQFTKVKQRQYTKAYAQMMGQKKTANTNGLAYNPINLSYDSNLEGEKLKRKDEDRQIRRYVRARNMDDRGNNKYDLITGKTRVGIQQLIPENLNDRYNQKLAKHYQNLKLKAPTQQIYNSPRTRYI